MKKILQRIKNSKVAWIVLLSLIIIAVYVRIISLPVLVFQSDIGTFNFWANDLKTFGLAHFYENSSCNYLPIYAYLLKFSAFIQPAIHWLNSAWSQDQVIIISYKLPCFVFDLLTAYFIFLFIKRETKLGILGLLGVVFYLFNPVIFHNTYIYGQNNVLLYLPTVALLYFLTGKKFIAAGISMAVLLLIKPTGIIIVPFALLILILQNKYDYKTYLRFFLAFYIALQILILPFSFRLPWDYVKTFIILLTSSNPTNATQMYSYNIWYLLTGSSQIPDSVTFLGKSYYFWGQLMFALSYLVTILLLCIYRTKNYLILATVIYFSFFIFPTRVHEGYLLFAFPIFILAVFIYKNYILGLLYLLTTLVYSYNIWGYWPWKLADYMDIQYAGRYAVFSAYVITLMPLVLISYFIFLNRKTNRSPRPVGSR